MAGVNTAYVISLCTMPLLGYPVAFCSARAAVGRLFAVALMVVLLAALAPAAARGALSIC